MGYIVREYYFVYNNILKGVLDVKRRFFVALLATAFIIAKTALASCRPAEPTPAPTPTPAPVATPTPQPTPEPTEAPADDPVDDPVDDPADDPVDDPVAAAGAEALAGTYHLDFAPVGAPLRVTVEVRADGLFRASTVYGGLNVWGDGVITGADGAFMLEVPEFGIAFPFGLSADGSLTYDEDIFWGIVEAPDFVSLINSLFPGLFNQPGTQEQAPAETVTVPPAERFALSGNWTIDLRPINWDAVIRADIDEAGNFYALAGTPFGEFFAIGGIVAEGNLMHISFPDFNIHETITVIDGIYYVDEAQYSFYEALILDMIANFNQPVSAVPVTTQPVAQAQGPEPLTDLIADLAGTYSVSLRPLGYSNEFYVAVSSTGEMYIETTIEGFGQMYVNADLSESNGVYQIRAPGFDASLRFTIENGEYIPNASDITALAELAAQFFPQPAAPAAETAVAVPEPEPAAVDLVAALAGEYKIDLTPVGFTAEIYLSATAAGDIYAEAEIEPLGVFYITGVLTEDGEGFKISVPAFNESLRFLDLDGVFVPNWEDLRRLSGMAALLINSMIPAAQPEPEPVAEPEPEPVDPIAELAGIYSFDLRPVGWDARIDAVLGEDGVLYAQSFIEGALFYIQANVTEHIGVFQIDLSEFATRLRFTAENGVIVPFTEDLLRIEELIIFAAASMFAEIPAEPEAVAAAEPEPEPEPADPIAELAGMYSFDLRPVGWDARIDAVLGEDGVLYAQSFIEGVLFYIQANVTEHIGVFQIDLSEFATRLRFTVENGVIVPFTEDLLRIETLIVAVAAEMFAAQSQAPVDAPAVVQASADPVAALAGEYFFDLSPMGYAVTIKAIAGQLGSVYAEAALEPLGTFYVYGVITDAPGGFHLTAPDFGVYIPFNAVNGEFAIAPEIWVLLQEAADMLYNEFFAVSRGFASNERALSAAPLAGEYHFDLSPLGYALTVKAIVEQNGGVYAEADLAPFGTFYVLGNVQAQGTDYRLTAPDFGVYIPFSIVNGEFGVAPDIWALLQEAADFVYYELFVPFTAPAVSSADPVAALAGEYFFDLSPMGYAVTIKAIAGQLGSVYAEAALEPLGTFYVYGVITEAPGGFHLTAPDFGVYIPFNIVNGEFAIAPEIWALLQEAADMLYNEFFAVSRGFASARRALNAAPLAGEYYFDLSPLGYVLTVKVVVDHNGDVYAEATVDPFGTYYVLGNVTGAPGGFYLTAPDFGFYIPVSVTNGEMGVAPDIWALLKEGADMVYNMLYPPMATAVTDIAAVYVPADPVAALAGEYYFDLSPLGYVVTVKAIVDQSGGVYAEANLPPFGSYYVLGEITAIQGAYHLTASDFGVYIPFSVANGEFGVAPEIWTLLKEGADMVYYTLFLTLIDELSAAGLTADIAGTYYFDLSPVGYDVVVKADINEWGKAYLVSTIEPFGTYYVHANVEPTLLGYRATEDNLGISLRFIVLDDIFIPDIDDITYIENLILDLLAAPFTGGSAVCYELGADSASVSIAQLPDIFGLPIETIKNAAEMIPYFLDFLNPVMIDFLLQTAAFNESCDLFDYGIPLSFDASFDGRDLSLGLNLHGINEMVKAIAADPLFMLIVYEVLEILDNIDVLIAEAAAQMDMLMEIAELAETDPVAFILALDNLLPGLLPYEFIEGYMLGVEITEFIEYLIWPYDFEDIFWLFEFPDYLWLAEEIYYEFFFDWDSYMYDFDSGIEVDWGDWDWDWDFYSEPYEYTAFVDLNEYGIDAEAMLIFYEEYFNVETFYAEVVLPDGSGFFLDGLVEIIGGELAMVYPQTGMYLTFYAEVDIYDDLYVFFDGSELVRVWNTAFEALAGPAPAAPAIPALNINIAGTYFVDMAPVGLGLNIFFIVEEDGTFYITDFPSIDQMAYYYAEGVILFSEGPFMSIPEWDLHFPVTFYDGDIAMHAGHFTQIMGFEPAGNIGHLERVKYDMRNVQFYNPAPRYIPSSRDGVYQIDLSPAGIPDYIYLVLEGEYAAIVTGAVELIADAYVFADQGLLFLYIPDAGIVAPFVAWQNTVSFDPADFYGLGLIYMADEIIGYKVY